MKKSKKSESIKKALQVIVSAVISFPIVKSLNLTTFYSILFFFGIYIAVSLTIEMIWRFASKKS